MKTLKFVIARTSNKGFPREYFCPKTQMFVHHWLGHRYATRFTAQQSLNAALANNPYLAFLKPVIYSEATELKP